METFYLLLLLLLSLKHSLGFWGEEFAALHSCKKDFVLPGFETASIPTRSRLDCLRMCSLESACLAVNVCDDSTSGSTCELLPILTDDCSSLVQRPACSFVFKTCVHGTQDLQTRSCVCQEGFTGHFCERHIRDCTEGMEIGLTGERPNILIQPEGAPRPFNVFCVFAWGGVTIVLRRKSNCVDTIGIYSQTWASLKQQHGDCNCHCFPGLDNLYFLIKQRRYRMKVNTRYDSFAVKAQINYPDVAMANESARYALSFGAPYATSAPFPDDAFLPGRNRKFCTLDNDCAGCAANAGHAGWFDDESGLPCPEVQGFGDPIQWPIEGIQQNLDLFALEFIPL